MVEQLVKENNQLTQEIKSLKEDPFLNISGTTSLFNQPNSKIVDLVHEIYFAIPSKPGFRPQVPPSSSTKQIEE